MPTTSRQRVRSLMGKLANERGSRHEAFVIEALRLPPLPDWLESVRHATPEEDHHGIDIVAMTDVGKLFLQVKSSRFGQERFLEKKRSTKIAVLLVKPHDTPEEIGQRARTLLGQARSDILRQRGA